MGVAAAEACFEMTREYVKDRKAFGTTLFKGMQTIRHELAEIKTEVAVRLVVGVVLGRHVNARRGRMVAFCMHGLHTCVLYNRSHRPCLYALLLTCVGM